MKNKKPKIKNKKKKINLKFILCLNFGGSCDLRIRFLRILSRLLGSYTRNGRENLLDGDGMVALRREIEGTRGFLALHGHENRLHAGLRGHNLVLFEYEDLNCSEQLQQNSNARIVSNQQATFKKYKKLINRKKNLFSFFFFSFLFFFIPFTLNFSFSANAKFNRRSKRNESLSIF